MSASGNSSLSSATQSVVAAWVGHLGLAIDYLTEAATIDLDDLRDDIDDGLHIAALAGVWSAVVSGLGGMKDGPDGLEFSPRVAEPITGLGFGVRVADAVLRVDVETDAATYTVTGGPLRFRHFGEDVEVRPSTPLTLPTPSLPDPGPTPRQPRGRSPREVLESGA